MPTEKKKSRSSRKKIGPGTKRGNGAADRLRSVKSEKDNFYIVGMGASAGGLEALEAFFKQVPPDSGMAFVLVPHLDPTHKSIMPELLQKHCRIKVYEVKDGTGRPLQHIASKLRYDDMAEDARQVLRTLVFQEREIQTLEDRWFLMRIVPYRRSDNVIDGVVITFLDIHEQKTAHEKIPELSRKLETACRYAESIITTVREPFVVLDTSLQIVSANPNFYEFFKVSPRQAEGRRIYDLSDGQWDIPGLRQLLEQSIA